MTDITELRRLYDAATKGEWGVFRNPGDGFYVTGDGVMFGRMDAFNAAFIAAAHNAMPELLDRLEKLERVADYAKYYVELVRNDDEDYINIDNVRDELGIAVDALEGAR